MKARDRVRLAISGQEADRVPKGEFWLGDGLVQEILGTRKPVTFPMRKDAMQRIESDLVAVKCGKKPQDKEGMKRALERIHRWRQDTDLFVFALVGGCFSDLMWSVGWEEFMAAINRNPQDLSVMSRCWCVHQARMVFRCAQAGADAILVGDDLAYSHGTFISPADLRRFFLPNLKPILDVADSVDLPVFLHSDGNVNSLLQDVVDLGFKGLHPIDPLSGMDLQEVKESHGDHLCLMGNVDTVLLGTGTPEQVSAATEEAVRIGAPRGRYILGSSGGFPDSEVSPANLLAMYETAGKVGVYPLSTGKTSTREVAGEPPKSRHAPPAFRQPKPIC